MFVNLPAIMDAELSDGSGSCYFRQWPSRRQQKISFLLNFFAYYFLKVHFHHFSKIKTHKEVKKTVGIHVFLPIFAWWQKKKDPNLWTMNPDGPKTYRIRRIRIRNTGAVRRGGEPCFPVHSRDRRTGPGPRSRRRPPGAPRADCSSRSSAGATGTPPGTSGSSGLCVQNKHQTGTGDMQLKQ